ncbi:DUF5776 domain-containing protein [Staphylococcus hominis]|uniref:DUF5776 domain-containing protein n=1 Tax=Staphylococcus hominis TaxID=1290 RepID=UPI001F544A26|nr:DUF5776 domain-containing protein [Staphylococcus hominis]
MDSLEVGARVEVSDVRYTSNGTPRLILKDGSVITANKDFITLINTAGLEQYITKVPETVKIIKACKLYDSRNFKDNVVGKLKKDDVLTIKDIIYTKNATPRLVTQEGLFLTANKDFMEIIK